MKRENTGCQSEFVKLARKHAKVLINASAKNPTVQYGTGKWQAIVVIGRQEGMDRVIVCEICYGRQRPYARNAFIDGVHLRQEAERRKKERPFLLNHFCKTETLLPVLSEEIKKIVAEKTAGWINPSFARKVPTDYVPKKRKGIILGRKNVFLPRGIIFSLSLKNKELTDVFFKGTFNLERKINGLSAKIGILLAKKDFSELKDILSLPYNRIFLLPPLLKDLIAYGNARMSRSALIYFLQDEKLVLPEVIDEIQSFWLSLKRSTRPISVLRKETEKIRNALGSLEFRVRSWNETLDYITIEVYPQGGEKC